jgi:hypothetical protein
MSLNSYIEFLFETYGRVEAKAAKLNLLKTLSKEVLSEEEQFYFSALLHEGYQDKLILAMESDDCQWLIDEISIDENLHESILTKAKEKAAAIAAKVKEKGKDYLNKISDGSKNLLKIGGNILQPMQVIIKKIGETVKVMWEKGKAVAQAAVEKASEAIREKIKKIIKDGDKKESLLTELGNLRQMAGAGLKFLTGGFAQDMAKSAETAAKANETDSYTSYIEAAMINEITAMISRGEKLEDIIENLTSIKESEIVALLESGGHAEGGLHIPFLSALMNKIGHTPPFSYFHNLGSKAEKVANNALERASYIISKLGGPGPFEFAMIGSLVGVAVGYYTELGAKTALMTIVNTLENALSFSVPGFGIVLNVIKYTGIALALYGVIKALVGQEEREEEKEEDEEKTDSTEQ